ncbi:hypothetical protein IU443_28205 [Nocardia farcinica]|jgi:hypothetical protein|uniref:hypothetical protein n=1 Tax=Nocardia farcinica TaxID=37329 RepID=UPI0018960CE2|nr:hypothetical protein [Nocardia farcinica]MBF6393815.1 hypothetical protein [Nocardia farcinica]MBF6411275.1 hypothetical protein [Nocardia farcinica]MCZ9330250.1 hypothetical protein [Nocardia farcinica]UEX26173.1 hypothetical protein LMJ57_30290 [Nocardia farcinica]
MTNRTRQPRRIQGPGDPPWTWPAAFVAVAALTAAAGVALVLALTGTTSAPTAIALSAVLTGFVLVVVKAAQSGGGHTRRLLHALAVLAGPGRGMP